MTTRNINFLILINDLNKKKYSTNVMFCDRINIFNLITNKKMKNEKKNVISN